LRQIPSKSTIFGFMREALRKFVFICMPSNSLHAAQMSILALEGAVVRAFINSSSQFI